MNAADVQLRLASLTDAVTISALSVQVFLDTYATEGVRPDLAREAFTQYSVEAFSRRLGEAQRKFVLAEANNGLLGFAEIVVFDAPAPSGTVRRRASALIRSASVARTRYRPRAALARRAVGCCG